MKILVTGASGNVGSHVVNALIKSGEAVVAAGTNLNKLKKQFNRLVQVVALDFTDHGTFDNALIDVDRVFLMRPPHLGKPQDLFPFIAALREKKIRSVCFLSLMGIEKNPIPPHYKIDKFIEASGIAYTHIRPGFFMQNILGIHGFEIKNGDQIFIPAGKSKTSFIDAADIGLAIARVLKSPEEHHNKAYTLTGPKAMNYHEVAQILSRVTGRSIHYVNPSFIKYRRHAIKNRGLEPAYVDVTLALYFMTRMGTAKAVTDDFVKLTGQEPQTFEAFAQSNVKAFCKEPEIVDEP